MNIIYKKISSYPKGTLLSLLQDAYSFDKKIENRDLKKWKEFDAFFYDNLDIADKYGFYTTLDNKPIGFVSWDPRNRPKYVEIGHNCISTAYKGYGYGKSQMKEAVNRIKTYDNLEKIIVTTDEELVPAQKMYEAAGFVLKEKRTTNINYNGNMDYELILSKEENNTQI